MNTTTLLEKLIEIDRALQHSNYVAARALVMQAEDCVLQMDRDIIHAQTEKVQRAAYSPSLAPAPLREAQKASAAESKSWSTVRSWRSVPVTFSRTLIAFVRTSLQRMPYPV